MSNKIGHKLIHPDLLRLEPQKYAKQYIIYAKIRNNYNIRLDIIKQYVNNNYYMLHRAKTILISRVAVPESVCN